MIYDTCAAPYDTDEIIALREIVNQAEREEAERHRTQTELIRRLRDKYFTKMLTRRPTYPTPEHLTGLMRVAQMVREGTEYGDHLGWPRKGDDPLPRGVLYYSKVHRINVMAHAPYGERGRRLWVFTDEEVTALRTHLEECGVKVVSQWSHEDGVAFIVAAPTVD